MLHCYGALFNSFDILQCLRNGLHDLWALSLLREFKSHAVLYEQQNEAVEG